MSVDVHSASLRGGATTGDFGLNRRRKGASPKDFLLWIIGATEILGIL